VGGRSFVPLAALGILVIGDRRRAVRSQTIVLDAVKLGAILMITFPIALAAIVFAVWAP
jgi:hypothetical protein